VKLLPAYSVKLIFLYIVKGTKIKITAKFRASRRLCFEDTKRIMSPEMRPESLETLETQTAGHDWVTEINSFPFFLFVYVFDVGEIRRPLLFWTLGELST